MAKILASAVCLATGWRGGSIIPLFFAGAAAGEILHVAFPAADPTVLMAGCMVATNVGVAKTPVGSTLVVAKMAGLQLLPSTTLAAALRMFLRFSEEAARFEGLTPSQHQLLLAIRGHHDSTPSVGDLAEVLQLRNNSVVGLVDRADAAGLARSTSDPHDGRRRLVSLAPAGRAVLERLSDRHREELRGFRDEMTEVLRELD